MRIKSPTHGLSNDETLLENHHYGFINYLTALSKNDAIYLTLIFIVTHLSRCFNSILSNFPRFNDYSNIDRIKNKSRTLYLGLEKSLTTLS